MPPNSPIVRMRASLDVGTIDKRAVREWLAHRGGSSVQNRPHGSLPVTCGRR